MTPLTRCIEWLSSFFAAMGWVTGAVVLMFIALSVGLVWLEMGRMR